MASEVNNNGVAVVDVRIRDERLELGKDPVASGILVIEDAEVCAGDSERRLQ